MLPYLSILEAIASKYKKELQQAQVELERLDELPLSVIMRKDSTSLQQVAWEKQVQLQSSCLIFSLQIK